MSTITITETPLSIVVENARFLELSLGKGIKRSSAFIRFVPMNLTDRDSVESFEFSKLLGNKSWRVYSPEEDEELCRDFPLPEDSEEIFLIPSPELSSSVRGILERVARMFFPDLPLQEVVNVLMFYLKGSVWARTSYTVKELMNDLEKPTKEESLFSMWSTISFTLIWKDEMYKKLKVECPNEFEALMKTVID
jgi:hypothetical protein